MLLKSMKKALSQPTKLSVLVFLLTISFSSCSASHLSHLKKKSQDHARRRRNSSKDRSSGRGKKSDYKQVRFALLGSVSLAVSAYVVYWCFYKKEGKQPNVLRIGTANAGGDVASNAFEFLEYKNLYSQSLQADYEKIHEVTQKAFNMPWGEFIKKYISSSKNEEEVLVTDFNFDETTFTGVISQIQNEQSEEKKEDDQIITMLDILKQKPYSGLSRIDKYFREKNMVTYSMLQNSLDLDIPTKKNSTTKEDIDTWNKRLPSFFSTKNKPIQEYMKLCNEDKDYKEAADAKRFYEIAFIRVLREEGLLETAKEIQKEFYKGPLGNNEEKAKKFIAIIKPQKLDIILLQEASQAIFVALEEEGYQYFFPQGANKKQDVGMAYHPDTVELKGVFSTGNKNFLTDQQDKNNERIAAAQFTHKKTKKSFFAVSVHSDSKGQDAIKRLEQIDDFIRDNNISDYPLIISHDANTTHSKEDIAAKEKSDANVYLEELNEHAWHSVFELEDYQKAYGKEVTSSKTRGYATQTQFSRGGLKENRGDFFAVGGIDHTKEITKKKAIKPGFSQENNTDHVIHIVDWDIKNQSEK